eukprot:1158822-Pelagomonas_calceolata.AAC.4
MGPQRIALSSVVFHGLVKKVWSAGCDGVAACSNEQCVDFVGVQERHDSCLGRNEQGNESVGVQERHASCCHETMRPGSWTPKAVVACT